MIDILTASPDEIRAEAERRTALRAAGKPLAIEGDPYTERTLGSGSKGMIGKLGPVRSHGGRGGAGRRTKWQAEWAGYLHVMQGAGQLVGWREEGFSVALEDPTVEGKRVHYRPDFYVVRADGVHELHETKGYLEEDARKTMRWFAQRWPFLGLRVLTKQNGRWVQLLEFNTSPWPYGHFGVKAGP